MYRRLYCLILFSLSIALGPWPADADAQTADHSCNVSIVPIDEAPTRTHLLEPVSYHFAITYDDKCQIEVLPIASDKKMICNKPTVELVPSDQPGRISNRIMVTCEYLSPGFFFRPPFQIQIQDENQHPIGERIPQMRALEVRAYLDEANRNKPLDDYLTIVPWNQLPLRLMVFFALMGLLLISGGLVLFFRIRKRKNDLEHQPPVSELKPIERFSLEIEQLINIIPVSIAEYKVFHDHLSNALRQYICARTQMDAMSCTTIGLCKRLHNHQIPADICEDVMRILSESDRVKFAYEAPGQGANMILLRDAANLANQIESYMLSIEAQSQSDACDSTKDTKDLPATSETAGLKQVSEIDRNSTDLSDSADASAQSHDNADMPDPDQTISHTTEPPNASESK